MEQLGGDLIYQVESTLWVISSNLDRFKREEITEDELRQRLKRFSRILARIADGV